MSGIPKSIREEIEKFDLDDARDDEMREVADWLTRMDWVRERMPRLVAVRLIAALGFDCLRNLGVVWRYTGTWLLFCDSSATMAPEEVWKCLEEEVTYADDTVSPNFEVEANHAGYGAVPRDPHALGAYMTLLRRYLRKADEVYAITPGQRDTLDVVRKITAIALRAVRDHG